MKYTITGCGEMSRDEVEEVVREEKKKAFAWMEIVKREVEYFKQD